MKRRGCRSRRARRPRARSPQWRTGPRAVACFSPACPARQAPSALAAAGCLSRRGHHLRQTLDRALAGLPQRPSHYLRQTLDWARPGPAYRSVFPTSGLAIHSCHRYMCMPPPLTAIAQCVRTFTCVACCASTQGAVESGAAPETKRGRKNGALVGALFASM